MVNAASVAVFVRLRNIRIVPQWCELSSKTVMSSLQFVICVRHMKQQINVTFAPVPR